MKEPNMKLSNFYFSSVRRVLFEFDRLVMLGNFLEKASKLPKTKTLLKDTIDLLGKLSVELKEGLDKIEKDTNACM